jgi:hypothetical protein
MCATQSLRMMLTSGTALRRPSVDASARDRIRDPMTGGECHGFMVGVQSVAVDGLSSVVGASVTNAW